MGYSHLSAEERAVIMIEKANGSSLRSIGRLLGRSASTIGRELRRQPPHARGYDADSAGRRYLQQRQQCRRRKRLAEGSELLAQVRNGLCLHGWSPQQIAARLRKMHPDDPSQHVSHETIYAAIYAYPRGSLKKELVQALRQQKGRRGVRRTTAARASFVPDELRIVNRPEEVQQRLLPGHWEGDLIKGAFNRSAVGVLVERRTRYVLLCRVKDASTQEVVDSFARQMKRVPAFMRDSLTYDRGSEMAQYARLMEQLNIAVWFADPHAPWQRGSNENTNGLLREYLPKGMDLSGFSQNRLNDIARALNGRPRKTLDWNTPEEAWAEEIARFNSTVALDS